MVFRSVQQHTGHWLVDHLAGIHWLVKKWKASAEAPLQQA
jgi:hypothetical protein